MHALADELRAGRLTTLDAELVVDRLCERGRAADGVGTELTVVLPTPSADGRSFVSVQEARAADLLYGIAVLHIGLAPRRERAAEYASPVLASLQATAIALADRGVSLMLIDARAIDVPTAAVVGGAALDAELATQTNDVIDELRAFARARLAATKKKKARANRYDGTRDDSDAGDDNDDDDDDTLPDAAGDVKVSGAGVACAVSGMAEAGARAQSARSRGRRVMVRRGEG